MNTTFLQLPLVSVSNQVISQLRSASPLSTQRPHAIAARLLCETTGVSTVLADAAGTNFVSAYLRPESGTEAIMDTFRMLVLKWNHEGAAEVTSALVENRLSRYPVLGRPLLSAADASLMGALLFERPEDREMARHLAMFLETLGQPLAQTLEELASTQGQFPKNPKEIIGNSSLFTAT